MIGSPFVFGGRSAQDRFFPNSCAAVIRAEVMTIMIVEIEVMVGSI